MEFSTRRLSFALVIACMKCSWCYTQSGWNMQMKCAETAVFVWFPSDPPRKTDAILSDSFDKSSRVWPLVTRRFVKGQSAYRYCLDSFISRCQRAESRSFEWILHFRRIRVTRWPRIIFPLERKKERTQRARPSKTIVSAARCVRAHSLYIYNEIFSKIKTGKNVSRRFSSRSCRFDYQTRPILIGISWPVPPCPLISGQ